MANTNKMFRLRWNDFESNISVALREVRDGKEFFDCTLSCGSSQIQAHKLILSACSPFFRSILNQNPHPHPLLYLKGVKFSDLQAILSFMYHGEVNVAQEEINSFLAVAEDLQVKGLSLKKSSKTSDSDFSNLILENSSSALKRLTTEEFSPRKRNRIKPKQEIVNNNNNKYNDEIEEVFPIVKEDPLDVASDHSSSFSPSNQSVTDEFSAAHQANSVAQIDDNYVEESYEFEFCDYGENYEGSLVEEDTGDQNEGYVDIDSMILKFAKGDYSCRQCGKILKSKKDLKRHIISKHIESAPVKCPHCDRDYKNGPSLQNHISKNHRLEYSNSIEKKSA